MMSPIKLHEALILAAMLFIMLFCNNPAKSAQQDDTITLRKGQIKSIQQLLSQQNKKIRDEAYEIDSLQVELDTLKDCIMKNSMRGVATTTCIESCDDMGWDCRKHSKEF